MSDVQILLRFGHVLTVKELEVMQLVARGFSQREIAIAVGVSRSSVVSRIETGRRRLSIAVAEMEVPDGQDRVVADAGGDRPEERSVDGGDRDGGRSGDADASAEGDTGRRRPAATRHSRSGQGRARSDSGKPPVTSGA